MMNSESAIIVEKLYKRFSKNLKLSMIYGLHDMFKDWRGISEGRDKLRKSEFWALKDINFELKRGQTLGIIGRNGSGKTTLLRMLNGIYPPDRGRIQICGKVSALISSGLGFHRHFTGRQNIFISGAVRGVSQKEMLSKLDAIIDFAEIGDFIDAPVATYSKGMRLRLGFAIAIHCPIDILLIDEIIAVGDLKFRVKCYDKLAEMKSRGVTILLVSHVMGWITSYSDQILLLNQGKVVHYGDVKTGVGIYLRDFIEMDQKAGKLEDFDEESEIMKAVTGSDDFVIKEVRFAPEMKNGVISMKMGEDLKVTVDYMTKRDFSDIGINAVINLPGKSDRHIFHCSNRAADKKVDIKKGNGNLDITIKNLNLNNYKVYLQVSIAVDNKKHVMLWKQIPVYVEGDPMSTGFMHFDMEYEVNSHEPAVL